MKRHFHFILSSVLLGYLSFSWAVPISVTDDCNNLQKNINAIREWTTSRSNKCELDQPKQISNNTCSVDVSKCLPPEVVSYHGKKSPVHGPNCWNLALVMAKVVPALRHTTQEEMAFFMNSPLCKEIGPSEPRLPGDIGAIRTLNSGAEVHGFMWISDELVFSKNGASKEQPYALQSFKGVQQVYSKLQQKLCKKQKNTECETKIQTLRCETMDSYLENKERNTPKKIQEAFIRLEHADKCISLFTFNPSNFNFGFKKNLISNIQAVTAVFDSPEFKSQLASMNKDEQNFIYNSLIFRLNSMLTQMQLTEVSVDLLCPTCYLLAREIRKSTQSVTIEKNTTN